jgi:prepilin-type N-terminal cleavage/methylation domain-containing protein
MKAVPKSLKNSKGFSLIEVIVVITVASVLFAMMFSYFGTSILDSAQPIIRLSQTLGLTQIAEQITSDFRQNPDLDVLKTNLATPSYYGQDYDVIINDFFKFNGNRKTVPGTQADFLIVKISQAQTNETITLLFTE